MAALVIIAGVVGYLLRPSEVADGTSGSPIGQRSLTQLTSLPGEELFPSVSPDGDTIVYASRLQGTGTSIARGWEGRLLLT